MVCGQALADGFLMSVKHLPYELLWSAPGYFALPGQIRINANLQSERAGLYLSMPPQRTGAWMMLLLAATFFGRYAATFTGLRRSPLRLSESDSRKPLGYGHGFTINRPMTAAHRKSGGKLPGKEKGYL